jgi:hypothetical protein
MSAENLNPSNAADVAPELDRAEWLSVARRQSQELAATRAEAKERLEWSPRAERRAASSPLLTGPRLAWVLPILAVLVTVGALLVFALRVTAPRGAGAPPPAVHAVEPSGSPPPPCGRPTPLSEPPAPSSKARTSVVEKSPKPRRASKKPAVGRPDEPEEKPVLRDEGKVIFDPKDVPNGDIIIVDPPKKLPPLFSPEDFKKKRGRTLSW